MELKSKTIEQTICLLLNVVIFTMKNHGFLPKRFMITRVWLRVISRSS